ncbi:reverse transcriptase domain-containing protein [Tanacetum coccineum]
MLGQHRKGMHEQFSQILTSIGKSRTPTPKLDASTFAITTRSGTSTRDPPYPTPLRPTTVDHAEGMVKKRGPEGEEPTVIRNEETPQSSTFYHPSKSSSVPFPSWIKKQKKDDDRFLSIFRQIHINLPFLEVIIHMPEGAKVIKDLLSHNEKLEKAASSVKLSEECSASMESVGQATAHAVIDVHEGKLSLRVRSEIITFNIGKSMRSKYSRDDYLYYADHTLKLIQEQWVDTVDHDVMTVVKNEKNELIPQRTVIGWRVCIDYRKLNDATQKDHFPLSFIDQMLERLAGHEYYGFLDGFSSMEVFMDDFSIFGSSFDHCLKNLEKMLKRCEETNLVLNWEKCHFMVKEGIALGHKVFRLGVEVDKAKIELISKLPYPTNVKAIRSFLGHAGFYRRSLLLAVSLHKARCRAATDKVDLATSKIRYRNLTEIRDLFPEEQLMTISDKNNEPWYADYANYLMERAMRMYGVVHRFSTAYYPQTNGQVENTNRAEKRILEKTIWNNKKEWSHKLDDALFLQINELDKLRLDAYESSISYKERTKMWHDKRIKTPMKYEKGDNVLLFNSRLRLFPGKLKLRWYRPFAVSKDMKNEAIELCDEDGNEFIVIFDEKKLWSS